MALRGVTSPVTTSANHANPPGYAVAAIDARGNLLLRDDRFDGDLAQATRHARTLASALADRHRLMVTATVTERATGRRVVTWTSWGAL